MANNGDKTVEFSVTKNKTAVNSEGIKQDNIPLPFNEAYCGEFSNNIPEPSGSTGWTLAPRQHMWTNNDQMETVARHFASFRLETLYISLTINVFNM